MTGPTTLADVVVDVARDHGDRVALTFRDQAITYARLDTMIERAADRLVALGVLKGERVALLLPNVPQFVVAFYAVARIGATVVPVNVLYKADELAHVIRDSEAAALIVYDSFRETASAALRGAPSVRRMIVTGTTVAPILATA